MKGIFKVIISYFLILFSLVLGISVFSFSPSDLSFFTTAISGTYSNALSSFGAYISAPFILFYGQAAWAWVFFAIYGGVRILMGITPADLFIRFAIVQCLALLWSVLAALVYGFSFNAGGIFGSLIASAMTGFIPAVLWIPFVFAAFVITLLALWDLPSKIYSHYLRKPVYIEEIPNEETDDDTPADDTYDDVHLEKHHEEIIENTVPSDDVIIDEIEQRSYIEPHFLSRVYAENEKIIEVEDAEEKEEDYTKYLSKKPLSINESEEDDILRDVDVDLLSPYLKSENPFYEKLEEHQPKEKEDVFFEAVESLEDLDQSRSPMVPDSQWVRESGVSAIDFIRKPVHKLSFEQLIDSPIKDKEEQIMSQEFKPHLPSYEIVNSNIPQAGETTVSEAFIEPQHISNFPPVSSIDSGDSIILEEFGNKKDDHMVKAPSKELTESEIILIQGLERTTKRQQEANQKLKEKIHKRQQELASLYHQNAENLVDKMSHAKPFTLDDVRSAKDTPKEGILTESEIDLLKSLERNIKRQQEENAAFKKKIHAKQQELADKFYSQTQDTTASSVLYTPFALQDFEQEILELQRRASSDSAFSAMMDDPNIDLAQVIEDNITDRAFDEMSAHSGIIHDNRDLIQELMIPSIEDLENSNSAKDILSDHSRPEAQKHEDTAVAIDALHNLQTPEPISEDIENFSSLQRFNLGDIPEASLPIQPAIIDNALERELMIEEPEISKIDFQDTEVPIDTTITPLPSSTMEKLLPSKKHYDTINVFEPLGTEFIISEQQHPVKETAVSAYEPAGAELADHILKPVEPAAKHIEDMFAIVDEPVLDEEYNHTFITRIIEQTAAHPAAQTVSQAVITPDEPATQHSMTQDFITHNIVHTYDHVEKPVEKPVEPATQDSATQHSVVHVLNMNNLHPSHTRQYKTKSMHRHKDGRLLQMCVT